MRVHVMDTYLHAHARMLSSKAKSFVNKMLLVLDLLLLSLDIPQIIEGDNNGLHF